MRAGGRRKWPWYVGAALVAAIALFLLLRGRHHAAPPPPPIPVTATRAAARDLTLSIEALGAAQAWVSDTILAQVSGKLLRVNFREGSEVRAGDLLAVVDPAPYLAALHQAEGMLRRDRAILAGAERNLRRYRALEQTDSVARQTLEDQIATVGQDRGTVEVDEANVAAARINLRWCYITAPISGRVGVRLVDPGNLVSAGGSSASRPSTASATSSAAPTTAGGTGSGIVVINQIHPIAVTFTIPQGQFERLNTLSAGFTRPLAVLAYSQESGELLGAGEVRIADNRVDQATGTVELKARFDNARQRLWPGQFLNVKLATDTLARATVIPTTAVNRGPNGTFVFVVGANGRVAARPIVTQGTQGVLTAVKSGVRPGDIVVTDGQMTLRAGSRVRIVRHATGAPGA